MFNQTTSLAGLSSSLVDDLEPEVIRTNESRKRSRRQPYELSETQQIDLSSLNLLS